MYTGKAIGEYCAIIVLCKLLYYIVCWFVSLLACFGSSPQARDPNTLNSHMTP